VCNEIFFFLISAEKPLFAAQQRRFFLFNFG